MKHTKKTLFALVCTGGGAHGAYQVGVLKYIHEHFCDGEKSPFQIFAGSSCGSLNTTFYAAQSYEAHTSRLRLEKLWLSFHVPAYHGNILKNTLLSLYKEWRKDPMDRPTFWSMLNPKPMRDILDQGFERKNLERAFREGTTQGVALVATELISGRACWFEEGPAASAWNFFHSIGMIDKITTAHLAASCSVPIFLPPVKIGERYYLDGSINLDRPLSAALHMGATRVLSIATEQPFPSDLPSYPSSFQPRLSHTIRLLLNRLSHDAVREETLELKMFNRFYHLLARKKSQKSRLTSDSFVEEARAFHYRPVEICLLFPSHRIRDMAPEMSGANLKTNRRTKTRFMFHEKFIRELIDLGYQDAGSRHEELKTFFSLEAKPRRWFLFTRGRKSTLSPNIPDNHSF